MNYCLIDESDPDDFLECEGDVLKTFFASSGLFDKGQNLELIRKNKNIEHQLRNRKSKHYNIFQFSAHGNYMASTKSALDYSMIVKRRYNRNDIEIFRPDSIVRTGLQADLFFSTNCETFNPLFIDIIKNYNGISNFIAPVNSPRIGNTLIFAMMFYNLLFRNTANNSIKIRDEILIKSFMTANRCYKKYNTDDNFRLYSTKTNRVFK